VDMRRRPEALGVILMTARDRSNIFLCVRRGEDRISREMDGLEESLLACPRRYIGSPSQGNSMHWQGGLVWWSKRASGYDVIPIIA